MKNKKSVFVVCAAALIVAVGAGGYWLGKSKSPTPASAAAPPVLNEKTPLYWHDPMVPGQKFDKPGKSPFMDMQLVPVYADEGNDSGTVSISPRIQQNLGIRTADVVKGTLSSSFSAVGSVAYNERDVAVVQARANGFIERLFVRALLDPVKKGQPLLEMVVPDWVAAQEEFLTVKRMQGSGTESLRDGALQRMRLAGMPEDQIRIVEQSGKVYPRMTIVAPLNGVVAELAAREGMTVMAGAPLFRINGLTTVWVNAEVPESAAARLRPGTPVEARSPAFPATVFTGRVSAILPEVSVTTRTIKARIELANPGQKLVPGMFATLNFAPAANQEMLLVPSEAVIQTGTRNLVMLAEANGKFAPVEVQTGDESNGKTEIRKGLEAGQKVVISGQFLIDSEASLKGTATRMGDVPPMASPAAATPVHHGVGKVEKIDKSEITLSHGPIPKLKWGAMTMGFMPPAGGMPGNVAVGDSVNFDFVQTNDGFQLKAISPIADRPAGAGK